MFLVISKLGNCMIGKSMDDIHLAPIGFVFENRHISQLKNNLPGWTFFFFEQKAPVDPALGGAKTTGGKYDQAIRLGVQREKEAV